MENQGDDIRAYHRMVDELKEKLRISEERRRSLQQKFDVMMKTYKVKEQARYNALRKRYGVFMEEDKKRQQRNENLLQMLERIDNRSANLAARTERLALLRKHYEQYLGQIYPSWKASSLRLAETCPPPAKIREYHEDDVSGYGTHTGSSRYVRESERYEEPRMPPISTPRASTHLYKTDNVLPDKYRVPRVDFDVPSISVTKADEGRRSNYLDVRQQKADVGRLDLDSKMSDLAPRRAGGISPRDKTPQEHLSQPDFEIDQNTSGDLLNMSLSDDGVPSLTRSETDAATRHQHWERLRHAYRNRQQPGYQDNERSSADESSQDMSWSRGLREEPPKAHDYRSTENARPVQQEPPTEQVRVERESFRDKIRRLKVMIQENKQMEQSIDQPGQHNVNANQAERNWDMNFTDMGIDNSFQQQRVRRQSTVDGLELDNQQSINSGQGGRNSSGIDNAFQQQNVRRQSVVDELVNPQSSYQIGGGNNQRSETQQRILGSDELPDSFINGRSNYRPESHERQQFEVLTKNDNQGELRTEQNGQHKFVGGQLSANQDQSDVKNGNEERQFRRDRKQSIDSVQNAHYLEQSRNYNSENMTNQNANFAYNEQYSNEQQHPSGYEGQQENFRPEEQSKEKQSDNYYDESRTPQDVNNTNSGQETGQYFNEARNRDSTQHEIQNRSDQPENTDTSEQYYQDNSGYGDIRQEGQKEHSFYGDSNQNYEKQGYNASPGDGQYQYQYETDQSKSNYYSQQEQGQSVGPEQNSYAQPNEQEYYQDKPYYGQQDSSNAEYDSNQQYSNQYDHQQQYDPQEQQQYDPQGQQQYDQQEQQQYDPQGQQQYDQQEQQQYDPQKQQQYDLQEQQPYDPQEQQPYDPQEQQQYDPQQQQYDLQKYDSPEQQYDLQQQQQGVTDEQYEYYGHQNQGSYEYDLQNQGRNNYENRQQNSSNHYADAGDNAQGMAASSIKEDGGENQHREETNRFYQDVSEESTLESDRSHEVPVGKSQESPSQRSIDRYRTMLGVDPNSDPAYSEVDEIEDEMAAVLASGAGSGRTQPADNLGQPVTPTQANIPSQSQPKQLETNPKQVHDDSSDFDYSSGP